MARQYQLGDNTERQRVQKQIQFFRKHPRYIKQLAENARPYLYYIYQETKKRGMPPEIALLPMVESNYNPFVFSKSGATGLWQLMPGTASGYGLTINWWYDGRRDIIASTKAALDYLAYLHSYFGDWLLAIAAYDSGEGTIANAIRHNQRLHLPTNFWALSLPSETRRYVPKLLALAAIFKNPNTYDLKLAPVPNSPYFEPIAMEGQVEFNRLATITNLDLDLLRKLNPGFRRWATQPKGKYQMLVPIDRADTLETHLADAKHKPIEWLHHTVKPRETLSKIAQQYHTTVAALKRVNQLKSDAIYINQPLVVPYAYSTGPLLAKHKASARIAEDHLPGPKRAIHVVRKRESLRHIARQFHVTPGQIQYWNNLAYNSRLAAGQKLIIWQKPHRKRSQRYRVRSGDTLSALAVRFHTKVTTLKSANQLASNTLRIGQSLEIPDRRSDTDKPDA